jgi:hypothetical protein
MYCVEKKKAGRVAVESSRLFKVGCIDCGSKGIFFILAHLITDFIRVYLTLYF